MSDKEDFEEAEEQLFLDEDFAEDLNHLLELVDDPDVLEEEALIQDDPPVEVLPEVHPAQPIIMPDAMKAAEINTISVFSGEKGPDAERFMDAVDRAKNAFQWSQQDTARAAQQRMTGVASQWIKYNARLGTTFAGWNEAADNGNCLRDFLEKRFVTGRTLAASIGGLAELQQAQKSMESTSEFVERLSSALDRKNYEITDAVKDTQAYRTSFKAELVKYLLHGLRDDLKGRVIGVPNAPTELNAILDICSKAEEEQLSKQHIAAISQEPNELPVQTRDVTAINTARSKANDPDRFKKFPCNVCKKLGHWANTCSQKPNRRQTNSRGNGNPSRGGRGRGSWRGGRGGGQQGGGRSWQAAPSAAQYLNFLQQNAQQNQNQVLDQVNQVVQQQLQNKPQDTPATPWSLDWAGN